MFEGELMPEKAAKNKNDVLRVNLRKEAGCVWKATESRGKDLLVTYSPQQQEHDNTSSTTNTFNNKNNKRLNPSKLTKILSSQVQKRMRIFYSKKSSQIAFCCAIAIALPCPFGHRYFLPNPYHFLCHK